MKGLEILETLTAADKRDRHADDRYDRQRRPATRVAIELRQHAAGDADAAVELAGNLDGVLPRHRVSDVEEVRWVGDALNRDQLVHQVVVDVQTSGRVDDHDVEAQRAGL